MSGEEQGSQENTLVIDLDEISNNLYNYVYKEYTDDIDIKYLDTTNIVMSRFKLSDRYNTTEFLPDRGFKEIGLFETGLNVKQYVMKRQTKAGNFFIYRFVPYENTQYKNKMDDPLNVNIIIRTLLSELVCQQKTNGILLPLLNFDLEPEHIKDITFLSNLDDGKTYSVQITEYYGSYSFLDKFIEKNELDERGWCYVLYQVIDILYQINLTYPLFRHNNLVTSQIECYSTMQGDAKYPLIKFSNYYLSTIDNFVKNSIIPDKHIQIIPSPYSDLYMFLRDLLINHKKQIEKIPTLFDFIKGLIPSAFSEPMPKRLTISEWNTLSADDKNIIDLKNIRNNDYFAEFNKKSITTSNIGTPDLARNDRNRSSRLRNHSIKVRQQALESEVSDLSEGEYHHDYESSPNVQHYLSKFSYKEGAKETASDKNEPGSMTKSKSEAESKSKSEAESKSKSESEGESKSESEAELDTEEKNPDAETEIQDVLVDEEEEVGGIPFDEDEDDDEVSVSEISDADSNISDISDISDISISSITVTEDELEKEPKKESKKEHDKKHQKKGKNEKESESESESESSSNSEINDDDIPIEKAKSENIDMNENGARKKSHLFDISMKKSQGFESNINKSIGTFQSGNDNLFRISERANEDINYNLSRVNKKSSKGEKKSKKIRGSRKMSYKESGSESDFSDEDMKSGRRSKKNSSHNISQAHSMNQMGAPDFVPAQSKASIKTLFGVNDSNSVPNAYNNIDYSQLVNNMGSSFNNQGVASQHHPDISSQYTAFQNARQKIPEGQLNPNSTQAPGDIDFAFNSMMSQQQAQMNPINQQMMGNPMANPMGNPMGNQMMGNPMANPMMNHQMVADMSLENAEYGMGSQMNPQMMGAQMMDPQMMNQQMMGAQMMNPQMMGSQMNPQMMNPQMMNPQMMGSQMMGSQMNPQMMNSQMMDPQMFAMNGGGMRKTSNPYMMKPMAGGSNYMQRKNYSPMFNNQRKDNFFFQMK